MKKDRCPNYDLLRIIAAFAVVVIHVSVIFSKQVNRETIDASGINCFISCIWNAVSQFAVPCFLMISGSFVLDHPGNENFLYFYRKSFRNVVFPTIIFSILFILYHMARNITNIDGISDLPSALGLPIWNCLLGKPQYHMWYMYLLIVIYLLTPFIIRALKGIDVCIVKKCIAAYFFFSVLSAWMMNEFIAEWNIGKVFCYLGFFLAGYAVKLDQKTQKRNAVICMLSGFGLEILMGIVKYMAAFGGYSENNLPLKIISPTNPVIAVGGVLVFIGFANLNVRNQRWIECLAPLMLYSFLIHPVVLDIFTFVIQFYSVQNAWIYIPLFSLFIFVLSVVLAYIYIKIYALADRKYTVVDRMWKKIEKCQNKGLTK